MTETDTSRSQLGDPPTDRGPILGIPKDDYDALLARAEKAEAAFEKLSYNLGTMTMERNEAQADARAAWNDAIEAAASKAKIHNLGRDYEMSQRQINAILALKKGDPT